MNEYDIATVVVVHVGLYTDLKVDPRYITRQGILGVTNGKLHESNTVLLGRRGDLVSWHLEGKISIKRQTVAK